MQDELNHHHEEGKGVALQSPIPFPGENKAGLQLSFNSISPWYVVVSGSSDPPNACIHESHTNGNGKVRKGGIKVTMAFLSSFPCQSNHKMKLKLGRKEGKEKETLTMYQDSLLPP